MSFVPIYILILAFTIIIDYIAGILIEKTEGPTRKLYLIMSLVANIGVLAFFKYFNFLNLNLTYLLNNVGDISNPIPFLRILLPIGLSFHTFQAMSYTLEVYKGRQKAETHFGIYALYVMFYPQLVAGPIERPQNILHQFHEEHNFDYFNVTQGLKRMLWGYFKKLVIADRTAVYVNAIDNNYTHHNGTSLALAALLFGFQIYCDFSGYTDIALGSAQIMGFKLMTNFNRPFFSRSITEFWRRWHISLSTWFNDYLFTPLIIGFRDWGKFGVVCALLITFFISGLWHGAGWTFIVFGVLHGIAVAYEYLTKKARKNMSKKIPKLIYNNLSVLLTFFFACVTWIFFRATSFKQALSIIYKILFQRGALFYDKKTLTYSFFFILILIVVEFIQEHKLFNNFSLYNNKLGIVRYLTYIKSTKYLQLI